MNETLGKIHFWGSVVGITLVFGGQMIAGYSGQQRRLYDPYQYTYLQHLHGLNILTSLAAFGLAGFQLLFVYNFFSTALFPKQAADGQTEEEKNPWGIGTLEWETSSPPPHHNFDVIPHVVRGPHEYANPEVLKRLKRDWLSQTEPMPESESESGGGAEPEAVGAE